MSSPMQLHTYLLFDSPPLFLLLVLLVRLPAPLLAPLPSPLLNPLLPLLTPLLPLLIPLLLVPLLLHPSSSPIWNRKLSAKHYLIYYNRKCYIPFFSNAKLFNYLHSSCSSSHQSESRKTINWIWLENMICRKYNRNNINCNWWVMCAYSCS